MPKLIKENKIIDDSWVLVRETSELTAGKIIVALPVWIENKAALTERQGEIGLLLNSDDEPESIHDDLAFFSIIAINFPMFSDGRGYTIARLLRERYHFKGELRAVGDVLQDQLFYMKRCGFDAFALREDKDIQAALKSLNDFSDSYQAGVDQPLPLFRRR
jgi:uncharacterized protein (DUF934 family)